MTESEEIQAVANNLVLDMYADLESKYATPSDDMIEECVDAFCKRKEWHTPKRALVYQEIVQNLKLRRRKDASIDIDDCACEIFNDMHDIDSVQYDRIEESVLQYLIDESYSQIHFDVLHKRVIDCIKHALNFNLDPISNPIPKESNDG